MRAGSQSFTLVDALDGAADDFGRAVAEGLSSEPKELPCRFFYDAEGSRLFEEICALPEYYLTRAEAEILAARAEDLAMRFRGATVVELGSGTGEKTEGLLAALCEIGRSARYVPIDICPDVLEGVGERLAESLPRVEVLAIAAEYSRGLAELARRVAGPKLVLWLGSNVGNFDRERAAELLRRVRSRLRAGDALLLGADLRKDAAVLEAAYDDPAGITARFNKNLLRRCNAELGAAFDLDRFRHVARYDRELGVMRMYLQSLVAQEVRIEALDASFAFAGGELVHTEDSFKYDRAELEDLARRSGMRLDEHWTDSRGLFSSNLLLPC